MTLQTVQELLQQEIQSLPPSLVEEVFDFVLFLKVRHSEEAYLWQQVEKTRAYRQKHPEEIVTVTDEEWDILTSHLEE